MANDKYWEGEISLNTDWGGDETTEGKPLSGERVQRIIKNSINSKVGYVGRVEKTGQGFYVLSRDENVFNEYVKTITEDKPFGDLEMDGINGRFDAPFNYKMNITLINPESGYKSTLLNSTGNVIKFKAETLDNNNTPQNENVTVTFKLKTEAGVETTYTAIYDGNLATQGIEYNLDGKLASGINTITITVVGMNTGISAMRRITYRLIDMYFNDKFNITKRYQFTAEGTMALNIGYDFKGVGKTKILWYFDGNQYLVDEIENLNPNIMNTSRTFYFTETANEWLTPGVHTLQMYMTCKDSDSGEEFNTPIYYREFVVEKTPTMLTTPYIVRRLTFDYSQGILAAGKVPVLRNMKQYENANIEYSVYYNGKSECVVTSYIKYGVEELSLVSSQKLPLELDDFSNKQSQNIVLSKEGVAEIVLRAHYSDNEYFENIARLEIMASDMKITTSDDGLVLFLNAFGRSNNTSDKDTWEYKYTDEYGNEQKIETTFSKNEYVVISTRDMTDKVIVPEDATENNTLVVNELPKTEIENKKYIMFNDEYYVWNREFDWSDTSGWSDNKLKLSNGNSITINYKPFSEEKLEKLQTQGGTYEFEFETTNVYNDDAVICRICGKDNYAPGIVIYASGSELVISREIVTGDNENAGYTKKVSTKYKAEESNRISFVITPDSKEEGYRNRILSIYVNGELCGAYAYDAGTNFFNDSKITFRGSEDACVNISNIKIYERALSSNEILNNYIFYRNDPNEKANIYDRNNIMLESNDTIFDSDKLKSQLPVMMIYQIDETQSLDDIHQEKKNKKLTRFFDVVYIDIQNPSKNFLVKNAYITPQGTSSMNYPVKNLRLYTGKKDDAKNYYSRLFVGSNIFIDGSPSNLSWDNINLETEVTKKRQYAFKDGSIPVNCWTLKADFAESSSSHNTGTARYWNNVLKNAGLTTKAQAKAAKYVDKYPYDVRTCVDGFPIVVFYQPLDGSSPRFEGKYNFNNDKSTEDVFGFTGGIEIEEQEVKYFYIGNEMPIIQSEENDKGEIEYACSFEHGGYTENPTTDSPLYVSRYLEDGTEAWYMLRGKELFDNPKMECWELLNSVNDIALFKTMKGFGVGDGNEKIGIVKENGDFDGAFESRYPDCGDYFHYNSLKRFGEWLVSCRYLDIDTETGKSVPFSPSSLPTENYHKNSDGKLSICSLTKQAGTFKIDFPGKNFYSEVEHETIASKIKNEGYQQVSISDSVKDSIEYLVVDAIPTVKNDDYEYIKCGDVFYTWLPSNVLTTDSLPEVHETAYDFILVDGKYYEWANTYNFADFYETQWVDDTSFNRALKFAIEKYDHIEMNKMAAYYIYLMRFGGVDQTVKNSMLTTEGPSVEDANSTLPSLWYFINYDNDTILGVKNDGRLVFDPYITRETKDGTGYVYAGRESTLWNNLEADIQFMEQVTKIDNNLADGGADPLFSLSYSNALREYDTNQSDMWCERIYNKDAERKYIDTYVKGWVQKVDKESTSTHVYEDYLYDVQGSRSAHRKWWLGRRFNVFDSRFCNTNFRNSLIKFRSTNLPAGSSFSIKSGEPIFYAWGHDNTVTEMTPNAIQPNDYYTFKTSSAFNIGSYLELMGAANISTLDLRNCVGALTEIDVTGCYSPSIGTKMKEILIGDNTKNDLINISNTSLKFSGLGNASKLETIDITNIQNAVSLDGLNTLLNIRKVYARGTSVANFTFADGAMIEKLELPKSVETLSLTRSSLINYSGITFDGGGYGKLKNLTLDNCNNLMTNPDFILNWVGSTPEAERRNLSLNLQGINWTFSMDNFQNLYMLEKVGTSAMSQRNIRGTIEITARLDISDIVRLKNIFGNECFKEGSKVFIKAPTGLYIDIPSILWEGEDNVKCEITTVGTKLTGDLQISANVNEIINGEVDQKIIGATNGIISMDESNIAKGYVTISVQESNNTYKELIIIVTYKADNGSELMASATSYITKRHYPEKVKIVTTKETYNIKTPVDLLSDYTPLEINDTNLIGRGFFSVKWEMIDGSENYKNNLQLLNSNSENAQIQAPNGYDGTVEVRVTVTRNFDKKVLCQDEKRLEFTNPDTIVTKLSNEPLYNILVKYGIIKEDATGFGKLTKTEAMSLTMESFIVDGKSIFAGNKELESFIEFQYFKNTYMGQMPQSGMNKVVTPDGMFKDCTKLKEISFSDNFKYAAKDMFNGCTNLEYIYGSIISDDNGILVFTNSAIEYIGENFARGCTKLKECLLSSTTKYIGINAFYECSSLEKLFISTSPSMKMIYDIDSTPFVGCNNLIFEGSEYGSISEARYKVKDGACYEINDNNTVTLIHMGKDTSVSSIPTDKPVYACAYSMEYRNEENVVVPANVIFNGKYIMFKSTGNSVTLTRSIGNNIGVFMKTKYRYYNLYDNETIIPNETFYDCTETERIVVPSTVTTIGNKAFYFDGYNVENTKLRHIDMLPSTPPSISLTSSTFKTFDVSFNVSGESYDNYYNDPQFDAFKKTLKMITLPHEGYFRIIDNCNAHFSPQAIGEIVDDVTIGGISPVQESNGFYHFINVSDNSDMSIKLNGVKIGEFDRNYATIFIGENYNLYHGNGVDFSRGLVTMDMLTDMGIVANNDGGWRIDKSIGGLTNPQNAKASRRVLDINLSQFADNDGYVKIKWGILSESNWDHAYIGTKNAVVVDKVSDIDISRGYIFTSYGKMANEIVTTFKVNANDEPYKLVWAKDEGNSQYRDSFWIASIGEPLMDEPYLPIENTVEVTINLTSTNPLVKEEDLFNKKIVITNDNYYVNTLINEDANQIKVRLPKNDTFKITSSDFVIGSKTYYAPDDITITTNNDVEIDIEYDSKFGIFGVKSNGELSETIDKADEYVGVLFADDENDIFILKQPHEIKRVWLNNSSSDNNEIPYTSEGELLISNIDGYENTQKIYERFGSNAEAISYVKNITTLSDEIEWYLPSYYELYQVLSNKDSINVALKAINSVLLTNTTSWTSNTPNNDNAWAISNNNPVSLSRQGSNIIRIFGKKKI